MLNIKESIKTLEEQLEQLNMENDWGKSATLKYNEAEDKIYDLNNHIVQQDIEISNLKLELKHDADYKKLYEEVRAERDDIQNDLSDTINDLHKENEKLKEDFTKYTGQNVSPDILKKYDELQDENEELKEENDRLEGDICGCEDEFCEKAEDYITDLINNNYDFDSNTNLYDIHQKYHELKADIQNLVKLHEQKVIEVDSLKDKLIEKTLEREETSDKLEIMNFIDEFSDSHLVGRRDMDWFERHSLELFCDETLEHFPDNKDMFYKTIRCKYDLYEDKIYTYEEVEKFCEECQQEDDEDFDIELYTEQEIIKYCEKQCSMSYQVKIEGVRYFVLVE
jgi:hypothetical protein